MEKLFVAQFNPPNVVDAMHELKDLLENVRYLQQHIDEKYFGHLNVDDHQVQLGIVHDYHRFQVFARVLSDNVHHAEALLKDMLQTIEKNNQAKELEQNV